MHLIPIIIDRGLEWIKNTRVSFEYIKEEKIARMMQLAT